MINVIPINISVRNQYQFITISIGRLNIMLALYELILNRDEKSFKRNIIAYPTSGFVNSCQWVGMCFRGFLWTWFLHFRKNLSPVIGRIIFAHPNVSGIATDFRWDAYPLLRTLCSSFKATCSCTWLLRNSGVTLREKFVFGIIWDELLTTVIFSWRTL